MSIKCEIDMISIYGQISLILDNNIMSLIYNIKR